MRLINTSTTQFREFLGEDLPYYAILSHTWGNEEVSFQDMQNGNGKDKVGFAKIKSCCALASRDGWEYVWIDTCCIDKSSSAELSEAINSMFEWYRRAAVCYVYLADMPIGAGSLLEVQARYDRIQSLLHQIRWFTRGWTLRELLAPNTVLFFNQNWQEIGTKSSLSKEISKITGIARKDLTAFKNANVAVKMSWASRRETTRPEDIAYCLLGLFGVNMPLVYGEGTQAFIRLQLEILKTSDDETIFAWEGNPFFDTGLLASSPADFSGAGSIRKILFGKERPEYTMTNKGLWIELRLSDCKTGGDGLLVEQNAKQSDGRVYAAPLNCTVHPEDTPLEIYLKSDINVKHKDFTSNTDDNYPKQLTRCSAVFSKRLETVSETRLRDYSGLKRTVVYVRQMNNVIPDPKPYQQCPAIIRYPVTLFCLSHIWGKYGVLTEAGEREGEHIIWLYSGGPVGVIFDSRDEHPERFAVFLVRLPDDLALTVIPAPKRSQGLGDSLGGFKRNLERWEQIDSTYPRDRVSRLLPSGNSVSVSSRPQGFHCGKRFIVDVKIDPSGRIEWPTSRSEETEKRT